MDRLLDRPLRLDPVARRLVGTLVLLLAAATGAHAAPTEPELEPDDGPVAVALTPWLRALHSVEVGVEGRPHRMLLDTGGGLTLLTPEAAARLGCSPQGRTTGHRMGGQRVDFQWCPAMTLTLGGRRLRHAPVAVFDLMALLPEGLPPLDGLLALDAFDGHAITLAQGEATLMLHAGGLPPGPPEDGLRLAARRGAAGGGAMLTLHLSVQGPRPGPPLWFLLDSGNLAGTLVAPHALAVLDPEGVPEPDGQRRLPRLQLGDLVMEAAPAWEREIIHDGVLGADFFDGADVTLDLRAATPVVTWRRRATGTGD